MSGGDNSIEIVLDASHAGWRLDRALAAQVPGLSRERLKVLTKAGALTRDGKAVRDPATKVKGDERFTLVVPAPEPARRRWLTWLVPLTAASAAVVLWFVVPRGGSEPVPPIVAVSFAPELFSRCSPSLLSVNVFPCIVTVRFEVSRA